MLTFEQFDKYINVIKQQHAKEHHISKSLTDLGLFDGMLYLSVTENIIDNYIELIEILMNDPDNDNNCSWTKWFIWENNFGNKKMNVTCGKYKDKQIRNNKDIYNIIVEWNKIEVLNNFTNIRKI